MNRDIAERVRPSSKSIGAACAWGIVAMVGVVLVSGILAIVIPSEVRTGSGVEPPRVGQVYSKEEIGRNERLAQEELENARRGFAKEGLESQLKSNWTRGLPYVALAALVIILIAARRIGAVTAVALTFPTLTLLLVVDVDPMFSLLAISALVVFLTLRWKWPSNSLRPK